MAIPPNHTQDCNESVSTQEDLECNHDFGCWGSKFSACETGTAYIRWCKVCDMEVERIEK